MDFAQKVKILLGDPSLVAVVDPKTGRLPLHDLCIDCKPEYAHQINMIIGIYPQAVEVMDYEGYLPMHMACQNGCIEVFSMLLKVSPQSLLQRAKNGRTALHFAAQQGNLSIIKAILNVTRDAASISCNENRIPLHLAAFHGCVHCVTVLYEAFPQGTQIEAEGRMMPLHIASQYKHLSVVRFLLDKYPLAAYAHDGKGEIPLHKALLFQNIEVAIALIDALPDIVSIVNLVTGRSTLHLACFIDELELVEKIVNFHPELIRTADNDGYYPIHVAAQAGFIDIFRLLADESISLLSASRRSALSFAAQQGHDELVQEIIDRDVSLASIAALDGGCYPIHLAAFHGHAHTVTLLIKAIALQNTVPKCCSLTNQSHWLAIHSLLFGTAYSNYRLLHQIVNDFPPALRSPTAAGHLPIEIFLLRLGFEFDVNATVSKIEFGYNKQGKVIFMKRESNLMCFHHANRRRLNTSTSIQVDNTQEESNMNTIFTEKDKEAMNLHLPIPTKALCYSNLARLNHEELQVLRILSKPIPSSADSALVYKQLHASTLWLARRSAIIATYYGLAFLSKQTADTSIDVVPPMSSLEVLTAVHQDLNTLRVVTGGSSKLGSLSWLSTLYLTNYVVWKYVICYF